MCRVRCSGVWTRVFQQSLLICTARLGENRKAEELTSSSAFLFYMAKHQDQRPDPEPVT